MKTNLLCLTEQKMSIPWQLGDVFFSSQKPSSFVAAMERNLLRSKADAWLFWDPNLGDPPPDRTLTILLNGHADVWHAGLKLGLQGQPDWINYVSPVWMLNSDPDTERVCSSWRLSLRACLIRTSVLAQLGFIDPNFQTLEAAGLALGCRYIRLGAFVQHVPDLVEQRPVTASLPPVSIADQCQFVQSQYGRVWLAWAATRAFLGGTASFSELREAFRKIEDKTGREKTLPYKHPHYPSQVPDSPIVTVIIPTVNRYPYLRSLLSQLRTQTIAPYEILIVDQTPELSRDKGLQKDFSDLPLHLFTLKQAGQCSSRNFALQKATGDFILFIDDDDSIPDDLIEMHLASLFGFDCDVSSGIAYEKEAGDIPEDFRFVRVSNVFPTNNTMIRKTTLQRSGLFDLAYDQGQRADHDLGMRLYLNGAFMVLNPTIWVIHHHAPTGGLRDHKARKNTYAAARSKLFKFNLPTISDIYLAKRYYKSKQVREMVWISVFGVFSIRGPWWKRLLKAAIGLVSLPAILWILRQRNKKAEELLQDYPQIHPYTPLEPSWTA
ncbi:glycosyltransferase [bacterium]|nr:glycosyltransferase [bacterium]